MFPVCYYRPFFYALRRIWMKKFINKLKKRGSRIKEAVLNERGDFYISDAVKLIIAVVLGCLLLLAMTGLFNDTVLPRITSEIEGLFG